MLLFRRSNQRGNTEDSDLGEGSKALIWTVCDLCSSLWITEVNKEHFLPFRLCIIKDNEDDLCFTLTRLKGHNVGLHAEVLLLLCESFSRVQNKGRRSYTPIWKKEYGNV